MYYTIADYPFTGMDDRIRARESHTTQPHIKNEPPQNPNINHVLRTWSMSKSDVNHVLRTWSPRVGWSGWAFLGTCWVSFGGVGSRIHGAHGVRMTAHMWSTLAVVWSPTCARHCNPHESDPTMWGAIVDRSREHHCNRLHEYHATTSSESTLQSSACRRHLFMQRFGVDGV